jgi:hypothetical protein
MMKYLATLEHNENIYMTFSLDHLGWMVSPPKPIFLSRDFSSQEKKATRALSISFLKN